MVLKEGFQVPKPWSQIYADIEVEKKAKAAPAQARLDAFMVEYEALLKKYDVRLSISEWGSFETGDGDCYASIYVGT